MVCKVAITLPEELYDLVERARGVEHRSRSEVIQEALRTHFGESIYVPSDAERRALVESLDEFDQHPSAQREWDDVRRELWPNEWRAASASTLLTICAAPETTTRESIPC